MSRVPFLFSCLAMLSVALWISGCGSTTDTGQSAPQSSTDQDQADEHGDHDDEGHEGHDHGDEGHEGHDHGDEAHSDASSADIEATFAKLSDDDRVTAKKQKICPVSDELLGTMGTPIKVDVGGRGVFICCDSCKEELQDNADKYLAKLEN